MADASGGGVNIVWGGPRVGRTRGGVNDVRARTEHELTNNKKSVARVAPHEHTGRMVHGAWRSHTRDMTTPKVALRVGVALTTHECRSL